MSAWFFYLFAYKQHWKMFRNIKNILLCVVGQTDNGRLFVSSSNYMSAEPELRTPICLLNNNTSLMLLAEFRLRATA